LRLGPLPETAVAHLIRQLAAAELPRISRQVWQLTQGNPFYVIAVLQHLFETGRLLVDGAGRWQAVGETAVSLPPTLRDAVAARLARLRPDQRQVFDLTAVAGGGIDFEPLQRASRLAEEALLDVVDELIAAGLLVEPRRPGLPAIAVAHDLYREVALETLTAARQRRYTRQLAA
ncbi:MAG: hypothetical protein KC425_12105, partial [Anaerolineales bacterium]|nr:hypothetical protein [Anaerolineales bacterium]